MPKIPDNNRFSYSRFKTFQICPLKHNYIYNELIRSADSPYTLPGKYFHEAIAAELTGGDTTPIFAAFKADVLAGKIPMEVDMLEYIVSLYFRYYTTDFAEEKVYAVEKHYEDNIKGDDYIEAIVDQVYERNGLVVLRDIKTTKNALKYTHKDVGKNQQLLFYIPYVENDLNLIVDAIEVDEVRMEKLVPTPLNANGKPTADRRRLTLTTYQDYYDTLAGQDLLDAPEYQATLTFMSDRGHPLFNRTQVHVVDKELVINNMRDLFNVYETIRSTKTGPTYRVYNKLCEYCEYWALCDLDLYSPGKHDREIIAKKITAGS